MTAPLVKGWCPGALRPMMSGDGLVVRVRPWKGVLSRDQALGLCDIADQFGNGTIDVTSRANLQIRGVAHHGLVLAALADLGALDSDLAIEHKRNILMAPLAATEAFGEGIFIKKKLQDGLYGRLMDRINDWPDLPGKMGIAIDLGNGPVLDQCSADFRFVMSGQTIVLRPDGAATGCAVTLDTAADVLIDLMTWFVDTGGAEAGRMARHLKTVPLPDAFQGIAPNAPTAPPKPGRYGPNILVGAPFGQMLTGDIRQVMAHATGLRPTPWRTILVEGSHDAGAFIQKANDPLLQTDACPGAPGCAQALQATRDLAQTLAPLMAGRSLHVSGCSKGCAQPKPRDVVIIGTKDGYDLVRGSTACDTPKKSGLTVEDIIEDLTNAL